MIHVACSADERYAPYCGAMLHSLLSSHPGGRAAIHFLHGPDLRAVTRQRLQALAARHQAPIHFHAVAAERVGELPRVSRFPREIWYRIFLPQVLPDLERVLYLDADTLVTDRLDELWNVPLNEHLVAAVPNVVVLEHRAAIEALELDPADYFNSGVLLMNLARMRETGATQAIVACAHRHGERSMLPDQDALNAALARRWLRLPPRWNCMNSVFFLDGAKELFGAALVAEAVGQPAILHFEGPSIHKPWHFLNRHPFRDRYHVHLRAAGWPARIHEGIGLSLLADRYLPGWVHPPLRSVVRWFGGRRALCALFRRDVALAARPQRRRSPTR